MPRIKEEPDGSVRGGALINVETATVVGQGRAVVVIVYATGPEHAAQIQAGKAEPAFLQLFGLPDKMREIAALLLRAADAVEVKPSSRN